MRASTAVLSLIVLLLCSLPVVAAAPRVDGVAYTEGGAAAVEVTVWQIGPPVVENPERLFEPVFEGVTRVGEPFAVDLPKEVELPVRVELAAEGHVAVALDVVVPEQAALPPAWLRQGGPASVKVTRDGRPVEGAAVSGSVFPQARWGGARGYRGHWQPVVARALSDEEGRVPTVLPRTPSDIQLHAVDADGRWGKLEKERVGPAELTLELGAREVTVRVVDARDRPVAGVKVAGSGPPSLSAVSGEDGLAAVWVDPEEWQIVALGDEVDGQVVGHGAPADPVRLEVGERRDLEVRWSGVDGPVVVVAAPGMPPSLGLGPLASRSSPVRVPSPLSESALFVDGPGVTPAMLRLSGGDREAVLELEPAARVTGRVVRTDGAPAEGVPVWADVPGWWEVVIRNRSGGSSRGDNQPWLPWAVSGPGGVFSLHDLPPDEVMLEARVEGLPPARSEKLQLEPGASTEVVLTLRPGARLTGRVLDQAGAPLVGVRAEVHRAAGGQQRLMRMWLDDDQRPEPAAAGVTDEEGLLTVESVPVGQVDVRLSLPGFVPRTLSEVEIPREGADLGDVQLEPGVTVEGWTVDADGEPVGDAEVAMSRDLRSTLYFQPETRSDEAGRFVLEDLEPHGEIYLQARAEGLVPDAPLKVELPPEGEVEVAMQPEQVIHGVVVEADGGRPVEGATVSLTRSVALGGAYAGVGAGDGTTDQGGLFRIGELSAGEYGVHVHGEGFRPTEEAVVLVTGERHEPLRLELERGATVAGRVVDPDGGPAAGAAVAASRTAGGHVFMGGGGQATTGADGRFTLDGQPEGDLDVVAWDRDGATGKAEWSPGDGDVEIRLEAAGAIEGRVVDADGRAVPDAAVRAGSEGTGYWTRKEADADGRFRLDDVPPGSVHLSAHSLSGSRAEEEIEVASGETATVTLRFEAGGVVEGRVVGLSAAELERCIVVRQPVAADGSFRIEGVPTGRREITAMVLPEGRTRSVGAEVPDDGTPVEVEIDFSGGVTLTGRVSRDGSGLGGVMVSADPVTRGTSRTTVTYADGAFEIGSLEPGEYRVQARSGSGSVLASEHVLLEDDAEVDLEVSGGRVAGWVLTASDRTPVRGARVSGEMAAIPGLDREDRTDAGGRFSLDDLPPGTLDLEARAEGYTPARQTVAVGDGPAPDVTLVLEKDLALELVVHRSDGSAPDAVTVRAAQNDVTVGYGSAACEADGRCRVTTLAPGAYTIEVARGDEEALATAVVPGPEVPVTLRPTGTLRVLASPAPSGLLWRVRLVDLATGLVVPASSWSGGSPGGWVPVGAGGADFRLPVGRYRVEGYGPDDETVFEEVEVAAGGEMVVEMGEGR